MADIATAIHARLTGDAALTGKLGGSVYPFQAPQGVGKPYITYQLVNLSERPHAMPDDPALVVDRYQVDIWALSYSDLIDVDNEVMRLLSRWRGSANGVNVNSVLHEDRRDQFEDETELYRRSNDFQIAWYE